MNVVVWLRSLGKYEAVFRENEIDETVLPDLTAEDLKELGVTALGQIAPVLRIKPRRDAGRAYKVAEHHRDMAPLASSFYNGCRS
jgi:hypothetical protein